MARVSGGLNLVIEYEGEEVLIAMTLIAKLPDIVEAHNSKVGIRNKTRVSKAQMEVLADMVEKTESFGNYLKQIANN